MTITRINEFLAKDGLEDELAEFLQSVIATIQAAEGCVSCQFLRSRADKAKMAIIEVWTSEDAHKHAASVIPPEAMKKAMELFALPPKGEYYDSPTLN